jgi:phospholipid/cholesterol/gamma-HCH transport system substrate-binding protein
MMAPSRGRELKVGLLVLAALAVLAIGLLILGNKNNFFERKNHYYIRFATVGGLAAGSPVALDGVNVGSVDRVVLSQDPRHAEIQVWLSVDRRYARRLRAPDTAVPNPAPPSTKAHITTQGLLGDKYIELNSGDLAYPPIEDGTEIQPTVSANFEHLMASGEDVIANVTQISHSLLSILGRIDRGEGLLGEMTRESTAGAQLRQSTVAAVQNLERVTAEMERGPGVVPRLLNDRRLAERLASAVERTDALLASAQNGPGLVPALLNDPHERAQLDETLANLNRASHDLEQVAGRLEAGRGLVPRLLADEDYGNRITAHIDAIATHLETFSDRLVEGNGAAARLVNDPQIYDAINDIIVGVNRSWMLRWLIQNRQKAGIKKRYVDATGGASPQPDAAPAPPPPPAPGPPPG